MTLLISLATSYFMLMALKQIMTFTKCATGKNEIAIITDIGTAGHCRRNF